MNTIDVTIDSVPHQGTERRFAAMGTRVHVIVEGDDRERLLDMAVEEVDRLEALWSRFRPNSETSRLNHAVGQPVTVSPATIELVERAVAGWQLTGGRFDPTLLDHLIDLGYDRTFDELANRELEPVAAPGPTVAQAHTRPTCDDITIDHSAATVRLPPGLAFDPGGIGKGLAADLVTQRLIDLGATRAMVNIGGDLRIRTTDPEAVPWAVEVDETTCDQVSATVVQLIDGAVATSTTQKRRWGTPEGERHHVLDPATVLPRLDGPILTSVIAIDAWWAEVAATAAFDPQCPPLEGAITRRAFDDGSIEQHEDFARYERNTS